MNIKPLHDGAEQVPVPVALWSRGVAGQFIGNFAEKPIYDFFVNAGIYVVNPEALSMIPHDVFFDMPSPFQEIPPTKRVDFPIHEYWLDIGRHDDLDKASAEYVTHFGQDGK
jgi:NDP-sugar pyrophosphorylase family protein